MSSNGFYQTKEWKALRRQVTKHWKAHGLPCAYCNAPIDWNKRWAAIADHVQPLRKAPELALDASNIVMMHHGCHSKKTAHVDYAKKPEANQNGFPVGSEWE